MAKDDSTSPSNKEAGALRALGLAKFDLEAVLRVGETTERREGRYINRLSSEQRKQHPMCTGFVDYFPDAMALVSHVSWRGNEKHNPGENLHHARGKSADHSDCVVRHQSTREAAEDNIALLHMAEGAWRAMAQLQEAMEKYYGLDLPSGARDSVSSD